MWLTSFLNKEKPKSAATKGCVTSTGQKTVQVDASTCHNNVAVVAPYGIAYVPPVGEGAVIVPFDGGEVCVGVVANAADKLERGELMLYSQGGASIVLKNNGDVLINGKRVSI